MMKIFIITVKHLRTSVLASFTTKCPNHMYSQAQRVLCCACASLHFGNCNHVVSAVDAFEL